jgi:hypothetical protein
MLIKCQLIFCLSLMMSFSVVSGSFAPKKQLTITNRTVMPIRVYVQKNPEGELHSIHSIGFVEPGERKTFDYSLKLGRWYLKIRAYAPEAYIKLLKYTLYVKQDKHTYEYELHNADFSNSPIPTPPNVSIIGTWASKSGLATEFKKVGDEYIGTIVACPESLARFGYHSGMEWIKVERTDFDLYKGTKVRLDLDGNRSEVKFSCAVEKGNELFPHNWIKR